MLLPHGCAIITIFEGMMLLQATDNLVEIIAMILLPLAVLMCAYALLVFVWRAHAIAKKQVCFWIAKTTFSNVCSSITAASCSYRKPCS